MFKKHLFNFSVENQAFKACNIHEIEIRDYLNLDNCFAV